MFVSSLYTRCLVLRMSECFYFSSDGHHLRCRLYTGLIPRLILCPHNPKPALRLHPQALPDSRDGDALLAQHARAVLLRHVLKGPEVRDAEGLEVGEGARVVCRDLVDAVGVVREGELAAEGEVFLTR